MPETGRPRYGSMQFWPRKKAKRPYSRVRTWKGSKAGALGFAGYKVGMTHVTVMDKISKTKTAEVSIPVTVIECPPVKIASVRVYKKQGYGIAVKDEIMFKADKDLSKKVRLPKSAKQDISNIDPDQCEDIRVMVYTQPKLTGIGKKKPELFELGLGGTNKEKLEFIKENLDKDITVKDVLSPGEQVDIIGVTKGKGYQGPVKRFGIKIQAPKSEKTKRGPGSLGGWKGHAHFMYRIGHAGQTGYHNRTDYNKWIMKIGDNPEEINPKGGFVRYGLVKNNYLLVKGSVQGSLRRLIKIRKAVRPAKKIPKDAPKIEYVSLSSKQGI